MWKCFENKYKLSRGAMYLANKERNNIQTENYTKIQLNHMRTQSNHLEKAAIKYNNI